MSDMRPYIFEEVASGSHSYLSYLSYLNLSVCEAGEGAPTTKKQFHLKTPHIPRITEGTVVITKISVTFFQPMPDLGSDLYRE